MEESLNCSDFPFLHRHPWTDLQTREWKRSRHRVSDLIPRADEEIWGHSVWEEALPQGAVPCLPLLIEPAARRRARFHSFHVLACARYSEEGRASARSLANRGIRRRTHRGHCSGDPAWDAPIGPTLVARREARHVGGAGRRRRARTQPAHSASTFCGSLLWELGGGPRYIKESTGQPAAVTSVPSTASPPVPLGGPASTGRDVTSNRWPPRLRPPPHLPKG